MIRTYGHGAFISRAGATLPPSLALFQHTQRAYLTELEPAAAALGVAPAAVRARIAAEVSDPFLVDALLIEELIAAVAPDARATMATVVGAMRRHYLERIAPSALPRAERHHTKGVGASAAARLEAGGITALVTYQGGQKYIDQCREAGVPIPPPMYTAGWRNAESFDPEEFISGELLPELWHYESTEPGAEGLCLALPRYVPGTDDISLFGLICLSTTTNKACFWDNPTLRTFKRGEPRPIQDFVGGFDLDANAQGVCSDCHSGENPFIIHPQKPAFERLPRRRMGTAWYEPIVHPNWPQNPGPTPVLDALTTNGRCDSCHQAGAAGRFPALSTELPGYCASVLRTAVYGRYVAPETAPATMPPAGAPPGNYGDDISTLLALCDAPAGTGKIVPFTGPGDASYLSPPTVVGPLYACATKVAVRGAVLDAKVRLHVGATPYELIARNPTEVVFDVAPLVAGDVVWVEQEHRGSSSGAAGMAGAVTVRDHRADYPLGLPAPAVAPELVHQCSAVIAVTHVPGASVTVYAEGTEVTGSGATGWTAFGPGNAPFDIGDTFTARQSLCGDPLSPAAVPVSAVAAPATFGTPVLDPARMFEGQQLVSLSGLTNGSKTRLSIGAAGVGGFMTPISWFPSYDFATPLGRAARIGDALEVREQLCVAGPRTTTTETLGCQALPAPRIYQPIAGARYVVVRSAVPDARIRVYDGARNELGDGSGTIIHLSRALVVGDQLDVTQTVGECASRSAHRLIVASGGK